MRQVQILSHGTLLVIKYRGSASCNTHLLATAAGAILKASLRGGHMQKYLQKIVVVRVGVRSVRECEGEFNKLKECWTKTKAKSYNLLLWSISSLHCIWLFVQNCA